MCLSSEPRGYVRKVLRILPQLFAGLLLVAANGCVTAFRHLPLSSPVTASGEQLTATVPMVGVSVDVIDRELSEDTRLLVVVDLTPSADMLLDLRDSRLLYGSERERLPVAAGTGEPPQRLGEETTPAAASGAKHSRVDRIRRLQRPGTRDPGANPGARTPGR